MPLLGMGAAGLIWTFGRRRKGEVKMADKAMILNKLLPEVSSEFKGIPRQWNQAGPDTNAMRASERENENDRQKWGLIRGLEINCVVSESKTLVFPIIPFDGPILQGHAPYVPAAPGPHWTGVRDLASVGTFDYWTNDHHVACAPPCAGVILVRDALPCHASQRHAHARWRCESGLRAQVLFFLDVHPIRR